MIDRMTVAAGLALVVLSGCAGFDKGALDPRVASQVIVTKYDPPPGCAYLGPIKGTAWAGDLGDAHADVLRNAVLGGGNFVAVDLVERPPVIGLGSSVVRGRLFACPAGAGPAAAFPPPMLAAPVAAAAPAPPQAAAVPPADAAQKPCEPECNGGFTCQLGVCVAAPAAQAAAPANGP
jgi:hypothetical protein